VAGTPVTLHDRHLKGHLLNRTRALTALALAGLVAAANSGLVGVGSAAQGEPDPAPPAAPAGLHKVDKDLKATCAFATPASVSLHATATLPAMVPSGQPAIITDFAVRLVLPQGVLNGESVEGSMALDVIAVNKDDKKPVTVTLKVPATPVPAEGELTLTASGEIPEFAKSEPGQVQFTVGAPTLTLGADAVPCTLDADQDAALGGVVVLAPAKKTPAPSSESTKDPAGEVGTMDAPDPNEFTLQPQLLEGWSTVKKLGAKTTIGPAFMVNATVKIADDGTLIARGNVFFPPSRVTFLAYGFMPTSATLEMLPVDYQDSRNIFIEAFTDGITGHSHVDLMARMSDAKVNGVPLDVGPDCVTATPISLDVTGPYDAFVGGTLQTDPANEDPKYQGFTLPPFKNCGATENLSPLLTGLSSGPGNQALVNIQSFLPCDQEPDPTTCPPPPN
jgi:hypothetical protein